MFSILRQLMYPKEFRISSPKIPKKMWNSTEKIPDLAESPQQENGNETEYREWTGFIKELGTNLWRIKTRLDCEEQPSQDVFNAMRFLQATWDILNQNGIEIIDHCDQRIIGGEMLRILSYEALEVLEHSQVIETIKPTISFNNEIIQIGEVIVGTPMKEQASEMYPNELLSSQ